MAKLNDLTGKTFGNWEVLYRNGSTPNKASIWRCRCNLCGTEKDIVGYSLSQGKTTKCRKCSALICNHRKYTNDPITKVWVGMKQRCYDPNQNRYARYGGRGIKVCDEWLNNCEAFCDWAYANGYSKGMSIERINVDGNYEPSNCKFIPLCEQARNRSTSIMIKVGNDTKCLQEWCDILNIPREKVVRRYKRLGSWHESILVMILEEQQH